MEQVRSGIRWRRYAALGALVGVTLIAGRAPAASGIAVGIKDFKYQPTTLSVPVGTTVTWTNHDEETHTVTSATSAFTSAGLGHDEAFAQTFKRAGTYTYFCALHPHMRATVLVK